MQREGWLSTCARRRATVAWLAVGLVAVGCSGAGSSSVGSSSAGSAAGSQRSGSNSAASGSQPPDGAGSAPATGSETASAAPATAPTTVLARVEQLPLETDRLRFEAYEQRLFWKRSAAGQGSPRASADTELPPTLTDAFVHDLRIIAFVDLHMGKLDRSMTAAQVERVLQFYLSSAFDQLRGLRPRAHQRFVKGLTDAERAQLAKDVVAYVAANGFKGPDPFAPM